MSFDVINTTKFPQPPFQHLPQEILDEQFEELPILGGILSDLKHVWQAKGSCLEVRNIHTGRKVGSWIFGRILKDSNTRIVAVDEVQRSQGRLSFLIVGLECTISGGLICVFDVFGSKVLRVIQVKQQITSLHVVDSGISLIPDPSPLKYFDGIIALGIEGGNVFLLDMCQQICENALHNTISIRDEINPSQMVVLKKEKIKSLQKYVQHAVDKEQHLSIHLNVVLNPSTQHFTLKGEKGDDRVHVNREEVQVSSLFFSPQLASLLVGYNFGAFQLWDLRTLNLTYTSPVCEEHIPVTHFTVQEPADDPKAYCYIWVSYSHDIMFHPGFPFAVMYSFYYDSKILINDYGHLYESFQHCSVRFQIELGEAGLSTYKSRIKGGSCVGIQSLSKNPINKDLNSLSLCLISWIIWNTQKEIQTSILIFDLNQWYKEQMPSTPNWSECSNYIIKKNIRNQIFDVKLDQKTLDQFIGVQRLEEHFCPTSLSFDLWCLTDNDILNIHNQGLQKSFIDNMDQNQYSCLLKPGDHYEQIVTLLLTPLFCEVSHNLSQDVEYQRDILLNVALEQKLIGWLCQVCSKIANNALSFRGLTLHTITKWAFQRAINLKNSCDNYCVSLFDYSGSRLDNNTLTLLSSSTSQIKDLCTLYRHISTNLHNYVIDKETLKEEQQSLENVVLYYEVLLWMVNIGLLPECNPKTYQNVSKHFWSAPYLVEELIEYYNKKRAQLQLASHDTFVEKDCLLYVDNLIDNKRGVQLLRGKWQEDGGSGLYPAPSLQSVLSIYLLEGADIVFKHSLVTYTLLDIASMLDEDNKVIKLLLKFPQIFDLTQSNIKIVQAFWHLDHDDYETALEYILDPSVLSEDLQHWHHSIMMRSLLLQEQYNLALVYLQIRKPAIRDEKDLFTVVSLLVSKNMLDEAFKFKQQHHTLNEQALLMHIFNECNKTESLHSLLYRCLNTTEERTFFKYLESTKNPRCEDLKVFYFLLRSRFLEAFDTYASNSRIKPHSQGLTGQREASTADNIIKMFKTLLPKVNTNLVDLVRKERTNLWKEVKKPAPLSVFVHNARDQVQYKSSVIFAALAKAKETFNDTVNENTKVNNDVTTEETPFLRTPRVSTQIPRIETPLIKSKVIEQNELGEEFGPSPSKRLKLSPRASKISPVKSWDVSSVNSKLSTPIVRRKKFSLEDASVSAVLPQSILKGSSRTLFDDSILAENTSVNISAQLQCENSIRKSKLGLTPRKPISKTPQKSHVKFDDLKYSSSSIEHSSINDSIVSPPKDSIKRLSNNSSSTTIDDVFLSPENSFEISSNRQSIDSSKQIRASKSLTPTKKAPTYDDTNLEEINTNKIEDKVEEYLSLAEHDFSTNRLTFQSPKSRRSYKRSFSGSPISVRSSPRLAKKEEVISSPSFVTPSKSILETSSPVVVQKVKGRRSLARTVLENNYYSSLKGDLGGKRTSTSSFSSSITSLNDTFNDSSNINESLDNIMKYFDSTNSNNDSLNESVNLLTYQTNTGDQDEIVSKTTEVKTTEIRKESFKSKFTNDIVSSKESKEEHLTKTVETFGEQSHELKTTITGSKTVLEENIEETDEELLNIDEISNDSKEMEWDDIIPVSSEKGDTIHDQYSGLNLYEDLSSGHEDIKQVVNKDQNKTEKTDNDSSFSNSKSYILTEMDMPIIESDDSMCDKDLSEETHNIAIPETEKGFVNVDDDVIEIDSNSEEEELIPLVDIHDSSNSSCPVTDKSNDVIEEIVKEATEDLQSEDRCNLDEEVIEDQSNVEDEITNTRAEADQIEIDLAVKNINDSLKTDHGQTNEHIDILLSEKSEEQDQPIESVDETVDSTQIVGINDSEKAEKEGNINELTTQGSDVKNEEEKTTPEKNLECVEDTVVTPDAVCENKSVMEETPLILRTVKKNYSLEYKLNATPKLNVSLLKRTYSRKKSDTTTNNISEDVSRKETTDVQTGQETDIPEIDLSSDQNVSVGPMTRSRSNMIAHLEETISTASPQSSSIDDVRKSDISKSVEDLDTTSTAPQTPRSRRITRRMSQLSDSVLDQTTVHEAEKEQTSTSSKKADKENKHITPEIESPESKTEVTKSAELQKVDMDTVKVKKRTRSASVDQPITTTPKKKSTRSKSIDLEDIAKHEKDDLMVLLTPIDEKPEPFTEKEKTNKATSDVGAYTTSRRLTRRQANMLKSIGTVKGSTHTLPNLEEIDPIHLLDKDNFAGEPDTSESRVYEPSSPSGSVVSVGLSRHTRSASVVSDVVPTKRKKKESKDTPETSGIKSRLRRPSVDTASVASEQSDSPSPVKKTRQTESETHAENPRKRGRSRTSSLSSVKSHNSDKTDTSVKTRSRRLHTTISELPDIQEDKTSEEDENKRGRTKKH